MWPWVRFAKAAMNGADISWIVSLLVTSLVYHPLAREVHERAQARCDIPQLRPLPVEPQAQPREPAWSLSCKRLFSIFFHYDYEATTP